MIIKFSHYDAFDDLDADFGNENDHVQICTTVVYNTQEGAGTLTIEGAAYDDSGVATATIDEAFDIG